MTGSLFKAIAIAGPLSLWGANAGVCAEIQPTEPWPTTSGSTMPAMRPTPRALAAPDQSVPQSEARPATAPVTAAPESGDQKTDKSSTKQQ